MSPTSSQIARGTRRKPLRLVVEPTGIGTWSISRPVTRWRHGRASSMCGNVFFSVKWPPQARIEMASTS